MQRVDLTGRIDSDSISHSVQVEKGLRSVLKVSLHQIRATCAASRVPHKAGIVGVIAVVVAIQVNHES
jgi:hypothetical protein